MLFLGLQVQRRSPRRPATPHSARQRLAKFGEAHAARQRLAGLATPCKFGEAYASHAYIGRLGMRTVKMVPLPGMLST